MRRLNTLPHLLMSAGALTMLATGGAHAHHPTGGRMPETLWHGFLSGIGHPVIGPDHLAFIIAIGIAAGLIGRGGVSFIAAFIAASSAGVLTHVANLGVPMVEPLVALSVICAGALLTFGRGTQPVWLALAAAAGLFHGYAFGETVVGAERGVIGAYLVGIAIIATVIATTFQLLTQRFASVEISKPQRVRVMGGVLGCVGLVMLVTSLVTA